MSLQITLIRHGKADKSLPNHREHSLSSEGIKQAENRRIALRYPEFDLVCHSILPRTKETALFVSGYPNTTSMIEIPGLFWEEGDPRGEAIDQAFDKLGQAVLDLYLIEVEMSINSLVMESEVEIMRIVREIGANNVLVVGHAVMIPALCRMMAGENEPFASFICNECEGFRLTLDDTGRVTSTEVIRN